MLQRKTDGERLAVVELRVEANEQDIGDVKSDIKEIRIDIKTVLRGQWLTAGALATIMLLMNYPQLVRAIQPVEAHAEVRR